MISLFYTSVPKIMIICYTVPEIWLMSSIIYFGIFFALLSPSPSPLNRQKKWKFQKNKQKYIETWSFHTSVPKIMIICYAVPEIWRMTNVIVIFYFGLFSTPLPPNSPQNQNFIQTKKLPQDIIILHMYQKLWLDDVGFLRYGTQQMNGQKKWHNRGGHPT